MKAEPGGPHAEWAAGFGGAASPQVINQNAARTKESLRHDQKRINEYEPRGFLMEQNSEASFASHGSKKYRFQNGNHAAIKSDGVIRLRYFSDAMDAKSASLFCSIRKPRGIFHTVALSLKTIELFPRAAI